MFDSILSGGLIYDGSGNPPFRADIALKNNHVAKIAAHIDEPALEKRDVSSFWICPGFVDIHTHYDAEVEIKPDLSESVRHGVTSIIMGNCSLSLNIGSPEINADLFERVETMPELISLWKQQAKQWPNTSAYLEHFANVALGPNIACMLGHSALRAQVMGLKRSLSEKASAKEIQAMKILATEALDAGCIGISVDMVHWHRTTGLYPGCSLPSHHACLKEYSMLASLCRERDAVFQVTPNPKNLWPSILAIVRLSYGVTRAPLRCTILSAMDMTINKQVWRAFGLFTFICNNFLGCNIRFQTIPEPFTIYSDGPITPLFEEFESGTELNNLKSTADRQNLWNKPGFKTKFAKQWQDLKGRTFDGDFDKMIILHASNPAWHGSSVGEIAKSLDTTPLSFFMNQLASLDKQFRWKHTGANHRDNIRYKLLKHPYILPGFSDAGAHCRNIAFFDSAISLIKQSVQSQFIPPEKAIQRVTYEAAKWFNLNAGLIKVGRSADLVVLDPAKLKLPLTKPVEDFDAKLQGSMRLVKRDPHSAIESVYIAGTVVVKQGNPIAPLGEVKLGEVLKSTVHHMRPGEAYQRYRNRINSEQLDHPFKNYWDVFVFKHQHPQNIFFHCTAFVMMYAIFIVSCSMGNPWLMCFMPFSQLTGLMGHYYFEQSGIDQRDTAFSFRALFCLHKLFFYVIAGRYAQECLRVRNAFVQFQESHL